MQIKNGPLPDIHKIRYQDDDIIDRNPWSLTYQNMM